MQTMAVQIQDDYIPIAKDKNLEYDPYFYERKKELEQIIEECENGTMEMLSQEESDNEIELFFKELENNS
jgi:hypothetical protein